MCVNFDKATVNSPPFSFENLAALLNSRLAQGYSNNEWQALACACLQHDAHLDGMHYQTCTQGGLHPWYVGFNPAATPTAQSKSELVRAFQGDLFDAMSCSIHVSSVFLQKSI